MQNSVQIGLGGIAAVVGGWLVVRHFRSQKDPEQKRRDLIDTEGRIVEGMVLEYVDGIVVYSWTWRGIVYEASQDLRNLRHLLPESENAIIGPVSVRFLPRDPSSSIVVSENWSGFRVAKLSGEQNIP